MLEGVNVALGVTGSIAAVKVVELAHELRRRGAAVRGVVSPAATGIIDPAAIEFATGDSVVTELTGAVEHIELCGADGWADVLLVAPATANTVGKMAAAIDDTPVTTCATTAIGADLPVVVAPAMHEPMAAHPGVADAIDRLGSWGVRFVDPVIEEGKAKLASEEALALETARAVDDRPLEGRHIVVTSGATAEAVDPVRVLTNRASGTTGRAIARACYVRGADVTLVHGVVGPQRLDAGPADAPQTTLNYAELRPVETTAEMITATEDATADANALVSAAAISDYTMDAVAEKIRSGEDEVTIDLTPTPKLLDRVRATHPGLPMVGFKVETSGDDDAMVDAARAVIDRVALSFMVANDASVMGTDDTRALFVDGDVTVFEGSKDRLGFEVADRLEAAMG